MAINQGNLKSVVVGQSLDKVNSGKTSAYNNNSLHMLFHNIPFSPSNHPIRGAVVGTNLYRSNEATLKVLRDDDLTAPNRSTLGFFNRVNSHSSSSRYADRSCPELRYRINSDLLNIFHCPALRL